MLSSTFTFNLWSYNTEKEKNEYIKTEMENRIKGNSRYHYKIAVEMYETFPILHDIWDFYPNEHFIKDRFRKREYEIKINTNKITVTVDEKPPIKIPNKDKVCALYLVGNTNFNPFTKEEFYWIKVGKTTDLKKRMKSYATHNPMLWKADYKLVSKQTMHFYESACHHILNSYGTRDENSQEWFQVSREIYLSICDKGFKFFEEEELYKKYAFIFERG